MLTIASSRSQETTDTPQLASIIVRSPRIEAISRDRFAIAWRDCVRPGPGSTSVLDDCAVDCSGWSADIQSSVASAERKSERFTMIEGEEEGEAVLMCGWN